jgi:NitT/TauT family transport system permease protein
MNHLKPATQHLTVAVAAIVFWKAMILLFGLQEFTLPQPESVLKEYLSLLASGKLVQHTIPTLTETLLGCAIGTAIGGILGYLLFKCKTLERTLTPYVIAFNSMPIVCIAPLVTLWFGFGIASKVILCAMISFFPVFVNVHTGMRNVDAGLSKLFKMMGAKKRQVFLKLEIPSVLPSAFAGLKIAAVTSVVGAVVGEFVGSKEGLGHLIMYYSSFLQTAVVFAVIIQLVLMSAALYLVVDAVERKAIHWKKT